MICRYRQIGCDIQDAILLILDEISMIGLEDLYYISQTIAQARSTLAQSAVEKEAILAKPFGGLHVIFAGDLYQLPPIKRTSIIASNASLAGRSYAAQQGKKLWESINCYIKFIQNHRVNQNDLLEVKYAAALSVLREGGSASVAAQPVLHYLNANNLAINDESCAAMAHPVRTTSKKGFYQFEEHM